MSRSIVAALCLAALPGISLADTLLDSSTLQEAFMQGEASIDMRYRYAFVTEDSLVNKARASTLRTSIGAKTKPISGFSVFAEFDDVSNIGNESYSDTINGNSTYPDVRDVDGTELNQADLLYTAIDGLQVKFGRQSISLDNERFVGIDDWSQQKQSYDGAGLTYEHDDVNLQYYYVNYFTTIYTKRAGDGSLTSDSHLINLSNQFDGVGVLTGYAYYIAMPKLIINSSKTHGVRFAGEKSLNNTVNINYLAEYARQSKHRNNRARGSADYYHFALGFDGYNHSLTVGYEELGADSTNTTIVQYYFGSVHPFQGWTDKFINGQIGGIEDRYITWAYNAKDLTGRLDKLNGFAFDATYHRFDSANTSNRYGSEWDLRARMPICKEVYAQLTYANYKANSAYNTTRFTTLDLGMSI